MTSLVLPWKSRVRIVSPDSSNLPFRKKMLSPIFSRSGVEESPCSAYSSFFCFTRAFFTHRTEKPVFIPPLSLPARV